MNSTPLFNPSSSIVVTVKCVVCCEAIVDQSMIKFCKELLHTSNVGNFLVNHGVVEAENITLDSPICSFCCHFVASVDGLTAMANENLRILKMRRPGSNPNAASTSGSLNQRSGEQTGFQEAAERTETGQKTPPTVSSTLPVSRTPSKETPQRHTEDELAVPSVRNISKKCHYCKKIFPYGSSGYKAAFSRHCNDHKASNEARKKALLVKSPNPSFRPPKSRLTVNVQTQKIRGSPAGQPQTTSKVQKKKIVGDLSGRPAGPGQFKKRVNMCKICRKICSTSYNLLRHEKTHFQKKPASRARQNMGYHSGRSRIVASDVAVASLEEDPVIGVSPANVSSREVACVDRSQGGPTLEVSKHGKCRNCSQVFVLANKTNHLKACKGTKANKCDQCEKSYTHERDLKTHKRKKHKKSGRKLAEMTRMSHHIMGKHKLAGGHVSHSRMKQKAKATEELQDSTVRQQVSLDDPEPIDAGNAASVNPPALPLAPPVVPFQKPGPLSKKKGIAKFPCPDCYKVFYDRDSRRAHARICPKKVREENEGSANTSGNGDDIVGGNDEDNKEEIVRVKLERDDDGGEVSEIPAEKGREENEGGEEDSDDDITFLCEVDSRSAPRKPSAPYGNP